MSNGLKKKIATMALLGVLGASNNVSALRGTLIDNNGQALQGATVTLINRNEETTTDANGRFAFTTATISNRFAGPVLQAPLLQNGNLQFSLPRGSFVQMRIFNLRGDLVHRYSAHKGAGDHALLLGSMLPAEAGVYVVQLRTPFHRSFFRYSHIAHGMGTSFAGHNSERTLANVAARAQVVAVDTLRISRTTDDVTSMRKILVLSYEDSINTYTADGRQMLIIDPSNDNDGDGLSNFQERYQHSTNAELADTDGDGVSDGQEMLNSADPLRADIPSMNFHIKTFPVMIAHYTSSQGVSNSMEISSGGENTRSSAFTSASEHNWKAEVALMVGAEGGQDAGVPSWKISGSVTATIGYGGSVSFSQEQSNSLSNNWNRSNVEARSQDWTYAGGVIRMDIELENTSGRDFTLVDPRVRLNANSFQASALGTVIGELSLQGANSEIYLSSRPGQNRTTRTFEANIPNPDLFDYITQRSNGLTAQLVNVQFRTGTGSIDTIMSNVYARTTQLIVDPGIYSTSNRPMVKEFRVTRNIYNDFYTSFLDRYISNTLGGMLDAVTNSVNYVNNNGGILSIDGLANGRVTRGSWSVIKQTTTDSIYVYAAETPHDVGKMAVVGFPLISVIYSADGDQDGLPDRSEIALGTNLTIADTDSDSILDGEEVFGWRRESDSAGIKWQTNPLMRSTDGDAIADFVDPDPLTAEINPLDSMVILDTAQISGVQQGLVSRAFTELDTASTLSWPVNSVMRGPISLRFVFSHPLFRLLVIQNPTNDTLVISRPDLGSLATYTVNRMGVLGDMGFTVVAISKDGSSRQTISMTGINRRLARVDMSNPDLFTVSRPVQSHWGIRANVYMNVDRIRQLDSLIQRVILLRADFDPIITDNALLLTLRAPRDLGDGGSGTLNMQVGNSLVGPHNDHPYRVISIRRDGNVVSSDSVAITNANDLLYFAYTSAEINSRHFMTAPANVARYENERTIVIDSIALYSIVRMNWNNTSPWHFVQQAGVNIGTYTGSIRELPWSTNYGVGVPIISMIEVGGQDLAINQNITFTSYPGFATEVNWRRLDLGVWHNHGSLPGTVSYNHVRHPHLAVSGVWRFGEVAPNHSIVYFRAMAGDLHLFDHGYRVFWRYKHNHPIPATP